MYKMSKKILIIINSLGSGGAERLVYDYISYPENKNKIFIYTLSDNDDIYKRTLPPTTVKLNNSSGNYYSLNHVYKIFKHIRNIKPDIVHAHLFPTFYYVAMVKKLLSGEYRTVVTEHGIHNNRRKKIYLPLERIIYNSYDAIVSVSNDVQHSLSTWLNFDRKNLKTIVISNAIQPKEIKEKINIRKSIGINDDSIFMLSVARLSKEKNLILLMEVTKLLDEKFKLVICGDGPLMNEYKEWISTNFLNDRIKLMGFVDDLSQYYRSADLFLLPSLHEGFGLSVLESIYYKNKLLISDLPNLREIYGELPNYFNPTNKDDLLNKIIKVVHDKKSENYNELRNTIINKYTIENHYNSLQELYHRLTN